MLVAHVIILVFILVLLLMHYQRIEIVRSFYFRPISGHGPNLSAMSNAYMSRFCCIHHTATTPFPHSGRCVVKLVKTFTSYSSLVVSPSSSLTITRSSSLVLTAQVSAANTTQRSDEWFALRRDRLTTSTFSTALGFWKGTRRPELWYEKVFISDAEFPDSSKRAMEWGVVNEAVAIERYKTITGHDVSFLGFAIHPDQKFDWMGASPDGLLSGSPDAGILEVKCPYNKGKPELGLPWSTMPFYYMPQIQGQMEIMGREWVDLYCWTPLGSTIFRVRRERGYWELIYGVLREFWWENVIPGREALLIGGEEAAEFYKPASTHRLTGEVIAKSIQLAGEAKLVCKDIAGHIEFYNT